MTECSQWRLTHGQKRKNPMNGGVEEAEGHGQSERHDQAHADGEDARHGEVRSLLDRVRPTEHDHGVEEHEGVAANHEAGVEQQRVGGRVAEAGEEKAETPPHCFRH